MSERRGVLMRGVRTRVRWLCLLVGCGILVGAVAPAHATASTLPGAVQLGFEAEYVHEGRSLTHHGVDVAMEPGDTVESVCAGRVVFAGTVPAGRGMSTRAVTIEDEQGRRWSYLPLERLETAVGDHMSQGAPLGTLAQAGDLSSDRPHLHLGLRIDGRYEDPAQLLQAWPEAPVPQAEEAPQASGSPTAAHQDMSLDSAAGVEPAGAAEERPNEASGAPASTVFQEDTARPAHTVVRNPITRQMCDLRAVAVRDVGEVRTTDTRGNPSGASVFGPSGTPVSGAGRAAAYPPAYPMAVYLMLATTLAGTAGILLVRHAKRFSTREVGSEPRSTRLQPW